MHSHMSHECHCCTKCTVFKCMVEQVQSRAEYDREGMACLLGGSACRERTPPSPLHHQRAQLHSWTNSGYLKLVLLELYVWQGKRRRPHPEHRTIEPSCNLRPTPACRMSPAWFNGYYSYCWRTLQIQLNTCLSNIAKERLVDLDNIYNPPMTSILTVPTQACNEGKGSKIFHDFFFFCN